MTKIQNPYETKYCEKCKFSVSNESRDKLFCKLTVMDPLTDKPMNCEKFKFCFSYQEKEKVNEQTGT